MAQRLIESPDIVATLVEQLKQIDAKCILLVRGRKSFETCGAQLVISRVLSHLAIEILEFADFSVNPKDEEAKEGLQLVLDTKPDVIVAIGGGSAMDMAKLIRHYAAEQQYKIPLWAIPTTAGTGAEATHFAVVYKNGVKHSEEAEDILPDLAILYPPFTYGNNAYLTACTGFDALAQAIEAFWNPNATEESRQYSKRAIDLIYRQLPKCVAHPQTNLRDDLLKGAYWAGRAINITKTTAPHAFSYVFTSKYNYPHGHAVALTFPFFMQLNGRQELFDLLELSADDVIRNTEDYISTLGLSLQLSHSIDISSALQNVNLQRLANNPVKVTQAVIVNLESYLKKNQNL